MKKKSISVNAILNAFRTGLSVIFPLITYPYAFRVLHAENIGKVNFASSVVGYFILIAALGFSSYAIREGAKIREDKNKISNFISQIISMNLISTIIAYVLLVIVVFCSPKLNSYALLIFISSLVIIIKTLNVEYLNTIYEEYLFITIRSIIGQIISLVLLFVLVHSSKDYFWYVAITVFAEFFVCVLNLQHYKKKISFRLTIHLNIKQHIKPILLLFANSVATVIYVNSDTTMLGFICGDESVGFYTLPVKIYTVIKNVCAAFYSVAIPSIAFYAGSNDKDSIKKIYTDICSKSILLLIPTGAGLFCVAKEIVMIMGGKEYMCSVSTLQILSLSLIGAIMGGLVTYCLNIPLCREGVNMTATIFSAIINIILNFILIPMYEQNGAAITTVISEFFVFIFCVLYKKDIFEYANVRAILKNVMYSLLGAVTVILVSFGIHLTKLREIISVLFIGLLSCVLYIVELYCFKNEIVVSIINKTILRRKGEVEK